MLKVDLMELYGNNHKKSQEKRITVEYIYGKSFFKNEKEIDSERQNDTILNMMRDTRKNGKSTRVFHDKSQNY